MPKVSVIIPMKNAEPYVRAAVESVLNQDASLEVVVVDDGSTDRSAEVLREIRDARVRVIPGPRQGIAAAFNAGLAAATGEFAGRCDADDLFPPGRLAWQASFLNDHPDFGAVCGSYTLVSNTGRTIAERKTYGPGFDATDDLRRGHGPSHMSAYLFRTALLRQIGGCRTFFTMAEDVDLQLRLAEIARVWYEPRNAYFYRLHDSSITHVQKAGARSWFEGCAKGFQYQRLFRPDHKDDLDRGNPPEMPTMTGSAPLSAKQQIQKLLLGQAWAAHAAGQTSEALSLGLRAWLTAPLRVSALRNVFALALKSPKFCM